MANNLVIYLGEDLHRRFKAHCADNGLKMTDLVLKWVEEELGFKIDRPKRMDLSGADNKNQEAPKVETTKKITYSQPVQKSQLTENQSNITVDRWGRTIDRSDV